MSQRRVEEAQVVSHMHVFDDEVVHHDEGQHLTALRSEVSRPGPWRARGKACGLRCDGEAPTLFAQPRPPRKTPYSRALLGRVEVESESLPVSCPDRVWC